MTKCQQETRQSLKDPARRDLIAGAAGAVGLVVFGGFICHSTVSEASLVRPPGSRPEAEFLARCIRCDRCRSVCHTNAVGIAHFETGFLAMRTPVMTFDTAILAKNAQKSVPPEPSKTLHPKLCASALP